MIPDELTRDLQILKERGCVFDVTEENMKIYIIYRNYPLPADIYNTDKTDLLIFTTPHYPNAGFDMFWVKPDVMLKNNTPPRNGEALEPHLGQQWRRFSYHPYQNKGWNPSEDSVISFMAYVQQRLQKGD